MCNENKCAMFWLELQAEILLEELAGNMSSIWTPTKCRSSLWPGPSFSYNSGTLPMGKERQNPSWEEEGIKPTALFCSTATSLLRVPVEPWSQGGLAGLYRRHRGLHLVLQPLVSGAFCDAAGCPPGAVGCHSGRMLMYGDAGTWGVVGCAPHLPAPQGCLRHVRAFWRAPRPIFVQLNHALRVSCSSKMLPAWMWIWIPALHYGWTLKIV